MLCGPILPLAIFANTGVTTCGNCLFMAWRPCRPSLCIRAVRTRAVFSSGKRPE